MCCSTVLLDPLEEAVGKVRNFSARVSGSAAREERESMESAGSHRPRSRSLSDSLRAF